MTTKPLAAAFVLLVCSHVICLARMKIRQRANAMPLIRGYSAFSMKQLDGFEGIGLEVSFLDGELHLVVTEDKYDLIEDNVIRVSFSNSSAVSKTTAE